MLAPLARACIFRFASVLIDGAGLLSTARLAQSAERKALNLVVVGSSPTVGVLLCVGFAVAAFRALSGYFWGGSGIVCMLTAFTGNA